MLENVISVDVDMLVRPVLLRSVAVTVGLVASGVEFEVEPVEEPAE